MKKVIMIDGNNLLFRSYYATAYKGNVMRNSKNFPTNALYGLVNMLNKIINEEKPSYAMIAFDKGKTFRHDKYKEYKAGRIAMPDELRVQFPIAKELCEAMGFKVFEVDNYEADDIIGTFAKMVDEKIDFVGTIISSDKDLLQLISDDVDVKLLKTTDYIRMNKETFMETYGILPIRMIDLKALMGDPSDNIPGVKGIGEKTAITLLKEYDSLENLYNHTEMIKGKVKDKLLEDQESAFFSKYLATIYKEVPLDVNLDQIVFNGYSDKYVSLLEQLEFFSLLKKIPSKKQEVVVEESKEDVTIINNMADLNITSDYAIYIEVKDNYHDLDVKGVAIYNNELNVYIPYEVLKTDPSKLVNNYHKWTYDVKKLDVIFKYLGFSLGSNFDDIMIASYLLNYNIKDDIAYLMNTFNTPITFQDVMYKDKNLTSSKIVMTSSSKAKFIYQFSKQILESLKEKQCDNLYKQIELPMAYVLSDMEYTGVSIDTKVLLNMKDEIKIKMELLANEIYNLAGEEFNILSPKQLGVVLFDKLGITYPKRKSDKDYSTSVDILNKLKSYPIVEKVLGYRMLSKIYSNYIVGVMESIKPDGKIHTIFNQTLTRTGRLSSINPNLQNIPIRTEYGRLIRKAFVPSQGNIMLSSDYSQIELRIFAHMSNATNLIEAFKNNMDIHTSTAMEIFHVPENMVTKELRRQAKAVNFGILYGISSFGLSEDLGVDVKTAKNFIDHYLETYPGIKIYMNEVIKDAYKNGYVKTLFGRTRIIEELKNKNYMIRSSGERMALNTPIQGTSADILKKAMIEIYNKFNSLGLKSKMLIQVHDELVFDVKKEEFDDVFKIVKDIMENTYKLNVPLKVEVSYGNNWYEAK